MSICKSKVIETGDSVFYNGCKCVIHYVINEKNTHQFSDKFCNICRLIIFDGIFEKNVCISEVTI